MSHTHSLTDRVERLFRQSPGAWINAHRLMQVGGAFGWRTRVSDCRKRGMRIENRTRRYKTDRGEFTISEYKFVPLDDEREMRAAC